jgi:iron complex outermembrane receptor protein
MKCFQKHCLALLVSAVSGVLASPVLLANDSPILEEMLVTAQKRVQSLRDVPVSVNAMSAEKIESSGLTNVEKLGDYIPSFNMTQTGIGTNIAIRGISSGVNQGFEQSTAQFVDGIHYGRAQLARAPFLDVERIEVLRGPQSILFGKNSTAGALSIINAKPSDEFEAKVTALYSPDHGEQDLRLVVSTPLSDTLGLRIAMLDSSLDGYMKNTTLNRDESSDKARVVRATLVWQPDELWDITLKAESGSFDSEGRNIEVISPVYHPDFVQNGQPLPGAVPYRNMLSLLTEGGYLLDETHDFKRQSNGDYSYNNTENVTLTVERELEGHTLTSVTGYNAYDYDELCDCDFTGAPGFNIISQENYDQFSQEIRIASSADQTFSYIGGLFYQSSNLKFHDMFDVPEDSFIPTALASIYGSASDFLRSASTQRDFRQDTDMMSVFAQGTWNFTDTQRLIFGARWTDEEKTASRHHYHADKQGQPITDLSPTYIYNQLWSNFKIDPHDIKGKRKESDIAPQLTYQIDINDTDMLYVSYTTGFKSGGFDVRANAAPNELGGIYNGPTPTMLDIEGTWEFQDENVTNYEIGGKFVLDGGAAELNVALFRSEFEDMQTSQFDGHVTFNVTNAGEAVVQGLEVDGRWAITHEILLRGGFAYIDFEYTKFPNSQCAFGQADNIAPIGDGVCDATGLRREFTPEWQGNMGIDYTHDFTNGLQLLGTLDFIYSDEYLTSPSLDSRMVQDAYTKINARLALSGNDNAWELALIGKNLTDESIVTYANGLPVSGMITGNTSSGYYAFYERPRSIAIQGTYRW